MSLLVRDGRVVCPVTGRDEVADVMIERDRIVRVGPSVPVRESAREVVDATGCIVMPGLVDLGVHLRDPGREHDETIGDTLRAALRGGVTTLVALPDTVPAVDGSDDVTHRRAASRTALGEDASPDVVVAGALTRRREGKEPADCADMAAAGVRVFGDAAYVDDSEVLRRSLEYARGAVAAAGGRPLAILSGPAADLARGGVVVESAVATKLGLPGVPELADALAAFRHIELAALAGVAVHLGPLFTGAAVAHLDRAPVDRVSAEAHPWHLSLDERAHLERRYDPLLRLEPPLPTKESRDALVDAVKRGRLAIASGHRAVPNRTKDLEFAIAEPGASSLSLTLPLLCGMFTPKELAFAASTLPATILGLTDRGRVDVGARADLAILRVGGNAPVDAALAGARSPANPWLGRPTSGRVVCTVAGGRVAFRRKEGSA